MSSTLTTKERLNTYYSPEMADIQFKINHFGYSNIQMLIEEQASLGTLYDFKHIRRLEQTGKIQFNRIEFYTIRKIQKLINKLKCTSISMVTNYYFKNERMPKTAALTYLHTRGLIYFKSSVIT